MQIFPAIDLKDGQCVRLKQGDFSDVTIYEADPIAQAKKFADAGASWMHMVDLDGAQAGSMKQFDVITKVAQNTSLSLQVGGGIRDEKTVELLLHSGVRRVVIGSLAVRQPELVKEWIKDFGGDSIVLALDVRLSENGTPVILTHGWQSGSNTSLWGLLDIYRGSGLKTILCTDVARDGMMGGTNHKLYRDLKKFWPPLEILASGGVDELDDLKELAKLGLSGVITGKAIYEGKLDLTEAIREFEIAR